MEAKFHEKPLNSYILGSPHVTELANNTIETMKIRFPEDADDWEKWQQAEQHETIIDVIKMRLYSDKIWHQVKDKEIFIKDVFASLIISKSFMKSLINEINENNAE